MAGVKLPGGGYFEVNGDSVTPVNQPPRIDFWVCPREDEPDSWFYHPDHRKALCVDCADVVLYLDRPGTTPDPAVPKICKRCMQERIGAEV